jgi:hypothetical protein
MPAGFNNHLIQPRRVQAAFGWHNYSPTIRNRFFDLSEQFLPVGFPTSWFIGFDDRPSYGNQPASKTLIDKTTNLLPMVVASIARAILSRSIGSKLITHINNGAKQLLTSRVLRFSPFFAFPD